MIDYRLLNTRLLADMARDVALTPAELDRLATIRRRQRRLRGYFAALARGVGPRRAGVQRDPVPSRRAAI